MWYKVGSVSLFSGSKVVLGNNTAWADKNNGVIAGGMMLIFADCKIRIYEIESVVSDTELVLASEYIGCTERHVGYAIPVFGSSDTFDHAAYVAQIAAMLAGYQAQLAQWKTVLTEHGQVTLTDSNGQSVVVKTLPDLTDAFSRMMDKTLNGADIPDKAQFVANLGLSDVVRQSDLANHTHTAAQITDFTEAVRKVLVSTLAAGQGVSLAYDNGSNQLTISATGTGGSGSGSGRGYTVVTKIGATAAQVFTFPLSSNGDMDYSFDAFALKEEAGQGNKSLTLESFDAESRDKYSQTSALVWDGTLKPFTGGNYQLVKDGDLYSVSIPADGKSLTIKTASHYSDLLPLMTTNNTPDGYVVSASSSYTGTQPYYAFRKKVTGAGQSWSSNSTLPCWLRVDLPQVTAVSGYQLAGRNDVMPPHYNRPVDFELQGSNDGNDWVTLDSQSGIVWNDQQEIKTFLLNKKRTYAKYRIFITKVDSSPVEHAVLSVFTLIHAPGVVLKSGDDVYSVEDGKLAKVEPTELNAGTINLNGFVNSGTIEASELANKLPVTVVGAENVAVAVSYQPYTQIAIPNARTDLKLFNRIDSVKLAATEKGNGKVRVAVSTDLLDWHVWNGAEWVNMGGLTADGVSAGKLLDQGMSANTLAAITSTAWATLLPGVSQSETANLAFALALDVPDASVDSATVDSLVLSGNQASAWKKQTEAEVEIRWYPDKVTFKTVAAGNYKLAYQQP
ncbi:discoidin domain-containing protein [Dickeya undicola]|uniref:discoidin domain-containing protein n=1 Tax=Dickeya undicola TaxID=1577887 RepID=UPI003F21BF54